MASPETGITLAIVDYPHTDASDWECATQAIIGAAKRTQRPFGVVATLPELLPESLAERFMAAGVVPFMGLSEAIAAVEAAAKTSQTPNTPPLPAGEVKAAVTLSEHAAKAALAAHGLPVPKSRRLTALDDMDQQLEGYTFPLVLKAEGMAHKSDAGGVALGLVSAESVTQAALEMGGESWLVEEMATGAVAELLVGVTRDAAHGLLLTIGAGGVLTELLQDTTSLLMPVTEAEIDSALNVLKCGPLLDGYRGKPAAERKSILRAILAVQDYVIAHLSEIEEVEINPLICTPDRVVAVDALIRKSMP